MSKQTIPGFGNPAANVPRFMRNVVPRGTPIDEVKFLGTRPADRPFAEPGTPSRQYGETWNTPPRVPKHFGLRNIGGYQSLIDPKDRP